MMDKTKTEQAETFAREGLGGRHDRIFADRVRCWLAGYEAGEENQAALANLAGGGDDDVEIVLEGDEAERYRAWAMSPHRDAAMAFVNERFPDLSGRRRVDLIDAFICGTASDAKHRSEATAQTGEAQEVASSPSTDESK